jgi:hypothetical protein
MIALRPSVVLWVSLSAAVPLWGWFRLDQADGRTAAANAQFGLVNQDLQRLADLRARVQTPARGRRPQDDLVTRAQQALVSSGLPIAAFSGVQPRADQTVNGVRIQTVQLRLQGLRPADVGAWLAAWSTPDQPWRLSELQMVHSTAPSTAGAAPLDTNRFDLTLVLTVPYLEDRP